MSAFLMRYYDAITKKDTPVSGVNGAPHALAHSLDSTTGQPVADKSVDGAKMVVDGPLATKIVVSGVYTWIAEAAVGTLEATAAWRVQRIDTTSGTIITWAHGNANFDNAVTSLPGSLTFS